MKLTPHLTFDGKSRSALDFYSSVFGGKELNVIRYGDARELPGIDSLPESEMDRIMSSYLDIGEGNVLAICDTFPGETPSSQGGNPIMLDITSNDAEKIVSIFKGLADGGIIITPLAPSSWSSNYGAVVDKFGISWNIIGM